MKVNSSRGEVMNVRAVTSPNESGVDFLTEKPLVALLGLVHFRIQLPCLVLWPPAHSGCAIEELELDLAIKVASTTVFA